MNKNVCIFAAALAAIVLCSTAEAVAQKPWHDKPRELRYTPDGEDFVINNGNKRFTRAIYGTNTGFRFETSDFPEFGLYMPNLGGSVYMAVSSAGKTVWIKDLANIESRFRSGLRSYTLTDKKILGNGSLTIRAVALSEADGFVVRIEPQGIPAGVKLLWIYGGANNQRFSREGDIGADPPDSFYIKPERCAGNAFDIADNAFTIYYGKGMAVKSTDEAYENPSALKNRTIAPEIAAQASKIWGIFPEGSKLRVADGNLINSLESLIKSPASPNPVLIAEYEIHGEPFYFGMQNPAILAAMPYAGLENEFEKGLKFRERIAGRVKINTPDPFFNTLGGIFAGAEDAVWEGVYLHGAIGWRMPLPGWRAAYVGDLMGMHDRARSHFDGYGNAQVTNVPVTKPPMQDTLLNQARAAKVWGTPMYSNGYISRYPNRTDVMNHYDMNLVYIDELLWHFNWTGDTAYFRKMFPVIKRHLAWEKQAFDPDNDFLYDGYCCIWASDGLQYNGGVATHSSAYNYRANKLAAKLAVKIGEDPAPYLREAEGILRAIETTLWIADKGHWAEFKDNMGHKRLHENAAVWTVYHSIDSEVNDRFQAYEATRYIDTEIPHIPVLANGLNDKANYVIATTNWQPYMWSINNVAFAETTHTALAFWQAGRNEEAYRMFKGSILDAMYLGSGPGNITQVSFYDAARGETYRDFADPTATGLRALVHGMFGILPHLMDGKLLIRPGFPASWNFASIETMNMSYDFKRDGDTDTYIFEPKLRVKPELSLELTARKDMIGSIIINGKSVKEYKMVKSAIGQPKIFIEAGKADRYEIKVKWAGKKILEENLSVDVARGDEFSIKIPAKINDIYDPQSVLFGKSIIRRTLQKRTTFFDTIISTANGVIGNRTLFVNVTQGEMEWWLPVNINIMEPVSVINDPDSRDLSFTIVNNSSQVLDGTMTINGHKYGAVKIEGKPLTEKELYEKSKNRHNNKQAFTISGAPAVFGTNKITIKAAGKTYELQAINWNIPNPEATTYEKIDISAAMNDKVSNIFAYGKYLAPRWQYTTLQVPTQGMGQWCHPEDLSIIDDTGLREKAGRTNTFVMPQGIPFATPSDKDANNIVFTTLWDNYPDAVSVPLSGKAHRAYLLIAGSTYHMQSRILNGTITVTYADGTKDALELVLPENLIPLDQDIFIDNAAFFSNAPRPWRVRLKTGGVSTNHAADMGKTISNNPIYVDGGMATVLDLPLDPAKEIKSLSVETIANEVIIGLMSITLVR